ncbi:PspC domain-containing protein [Actinomycetaceae bacterium MB13-C1-2]|nr:PspC domain-containing protein [Actinomycetaceae bacterium MB13-C1-2]
MQKKLVRDPNNKMIAGVCSGIAEYFGWDATWVRAAFGISLLFGGTGFFIYIVLWIVMPEGPMYPVPPQWPAPNSTEYPGFEYQGNPYRASTYPADGNPTDPYQANNYPPTTYPQTSYSDSAQSEDRDS